MWGGYKCFLVYFRSSNITHSMQHRYNAAALSFKKSSTQHQRKCFKGTILNKIHVYLQMTLLMAYLYEHVQHKDEENNRKGLPATKCQRQLQEKLEIHIRRTTFPQVLKYISILILKGHIITFRQINTCCATIRRPQHQNLRHLLNKPITCEQM